MDSNFTAIPPQLWDEVSPLLPSESVGGRPARSNYTILAGVIYRLRTGCQWRAIPRSIAPGTTVHGRFQQWVNEGVFERIYKVLIRYYDNLKGIDWEWASMDSASVKAPKGGDDTGPSPTDRAKLGSKRHIMTDSAGVPVALTISGANTHDKKKAIETLDAVILRDGRGLRRPIHLCLDKGYDYRDIEEEVTLRNIVPHIRRRGEPPMVGRVHGKARRWVVERTNSWHNRFRGIMIRWERKSSNYLALVQLACGVIAFNLASAAI